ncbi:unnamed protein product [Soboliphyme baturini]|uniref:Uncharacterized protein n=1 Tax=Soboliphyme baturini TaxID=241478 RepID=A0A183J0F4_9BILA|nr:unnamed protein product [Soboliphyme baturini]
MKEEEKGEEVKAVNVEEQDEEKVTRKKSLPERVKWILGRDLPELEKRRTGYGCLDARAVRADLWLQRPD